jgi:hypothetical protein
MIPALEEVAANDPAPEVEGHSIRNPQPSPSQKSRSAKRYNDAIANWS